ncbi:MAG: glucose 1-dehydrogenase [Synergistaceae bacterium]|jgi:gluconate 5-dehydrogenase|nr:glucose 1-dehydrogenase [Synergistaceae bacterium]
MFEPFNLTGKYAVVVGGAGGIGKAIAGGLLQSGAVVGIASRNLDSLNEAADLLRKQANGRVEVFQVDASEESSIAGLAENVVKSFGRVDILVNAQGFNTKGPALEFDMTEWDRLYTVNVRGVMLCCKVFGKYMVDQGGGKIINLSSVRGIRANAGGNSAYCSSKAAVDLITKSIATELAKNNVQVNALGPVLIATKMMEKVMAEPGRAEQYTRNIPMGRLGKVEDVVGAAVFLASSAANFITGQVLYIDGGLTAAG